MESPWWVLAGGVAGLAGGILFLVVLFRWRHEMAERGWKYTPLGLAFLGIFVLAGSALNLLLGWPPALSTGVALGWILSLAIMVAGIVLDAWRRTRQST